MHQHPRPSPFVASPANSEQTNPTRTNNPRDRDVQTLRTTSTQGSGSSEDFANTRQETTSDNNPAAQMQRLNQVIQNFHTKAALIILRSRIDLPAAYSSRNNEKRVNRWFNIELDETDEYNDDIRKWRKCDVKNDRPPPLVIEVFLTTEPLPQGQRLIILDDEQKRWDVSNALASSGGAKTKGRQPENDEILLERWTVELDEPTASLPPDLTSILPLVYKKSIVLFRSLYTYCNFLPAWKLTRKVGRSRHNMAMKIGYRILDGSRMQELSRPDNLDAPLCDSTADVTTSYSFGVTDSPAGPFSVKVKYRENCEFRIDDTEELLSSRFLGTDDDLFRPSLPHAEHLNADNESTKPGSLPNDARRNLRERPELGHAYGSMSTFHQAGFSPGTSPMSALRSARDMGQASPSPDQTRPTPQAQPPGQSRPSLRAAATGRRSSVSLQPFKAPALSASPLGASPLAGSPRTSATRVPVLGSLTEESSIPPSNTQAIAARKSGSQMPEQGVLVPGSTSPKPAPVRYSSSFSHRRSRPSIDRITNKTDDDVSSGRGSATSSVAPPPGSAMMTEAAPGGTSSGSMQEDDENISDFLKMLDTKKDHLGQSEISINDAAARRTANALNRFHRMRDTNATLSDSMSSSLMLQKSSQASSRQLSGVPPMVAPTSVSSSSSPGKPISPHTPHTPFAPSRLSAAYSHEDAEAQQVVVDDEQTPDDGTKDEDTTQDTSTSNVPAIDIPTSPRPFLAGYRRSSSAQRRPISSEDDIGDLYGMRSASMGAHDRKSSRPTASNAAAEAAAKDADTQPGNNEMRQKPQFPGTQDDSATSDSGSNRSPVRNVQRTRMSQGSNLRSHAAVTPPQGSTSSFGGTGGSIDRGGDSGGSTSIDWGRSRRFRSGSRVERPETRALVDDDEFLPFAMEKSDLQTVFGREQGPDAK